MSIVNTARVFTLIGAVISFIFSGILLILLTLFLIIPTLIDGIGEHVYVVDGFLFIIFSALLIVGILKIWAYQLMLNRKELFKAGLVTLISGIVVGPDIFAVVGGILALVESEKKK